MKAIARLVERVLDRFLNIVAARVEAGLEIVAANAQRELLEEAARHSAECECGELIAKNLCRAASRFEQLGGVSQPALPEPTRVPPAKTAASKGDGSGKSKRGRPRKAGLPAAGEPGMSVNSSANPDELNKESA